MDVKISKIAKNEPELVHIKCHNVTEQVRDIETYVKSMQGHLTGMMNGMQYEILTSEIYYIEAVDNKTYFYGKECVYEGKQRLYEYEEQLCEKQYLRVSKTCILNLMKVQAIKPALNGRFLAVLQNGEQIIISRKYAQDLKQKLKGARK